MRTRKTSLIILNLVVAVLVLLPLYRLDLYRENYSTLSLDTRGYLYLLFLGICTGLLLGYETAVTYDPQKGMIMFMVLILAAAVPHHIPYDLQGLLHLFLSYSGAFVIIMLTVYNLQKNRFPMLRNIYIILVSAALTAYFRYGMVTTLMEVFIIFHTLSVNLYLYLKHN